MKRFFFEDLHSLTAMDQIFVSPIQPQIHMLKADGQCDGIERWDLWKVLSS